MKFTLASARTFPPWLSEGWTIHFVERDSRYWLEARAGLKDEALFEESVKAAWDWAKPSSSIRWFTDGERRYSKKLWKLASVYLPGSATTEVYPFRKVWREGLEVAIKIKGSQGKPRIEWVKQEHPYTAVSPKSEVHANHNEALNSALSSQLFYQLLSWAKSRHPNLNGHQTVSRYWLVNSGGGWIFQAKDGPKLRTHRQIQFHLHTKVRGKCSPYDGDWVYWGTRARFYPGLSPLKSYLLRHQEGKCPQCGLNFMPNNSIEMHYLDGNPVNFRRDNLALMHRFCQPSKVHATVKPSTPGTDDKQPSWREAG